MLFQAGFHKIADDRGSQIADRRRSQKGLLQYKKPTFAYISVSGSVEITGALC